MISGVSPGTLVGMERGELGSVHSLVQVLKEVVEAVRQWPRFAADAGVSKVQIKRIGELHRVEW